MTYLLNRTVFSKAFIVIEFGSLGNRMDLYHLDLIIGTAGLLFDFGSAGLFQFDFTSSLLLIDHFY